MQPPYGEKVSVRESLSSVWRELLGVHSVDASDNFLELGGDSITATLCVNRIRSLFGVTIPVSLLLLDDGSLGGLEAEVVCALDRPESVHGS